MRHERDDDVVRRVVEAVAREIRADRVAVLLPFHVDGRFLQALLRSPTVAWVAQDTAELVAHPTSAGVRVLVVVGFIHDLSIRALPALWRAGIRTVATADATGGTRVTTLPAHGIGIAMSKARIAVDERLRTAPELAPTLLRREAKIARALSRLHPMRARAATSSARAANLLDRGAPLVLACGSIAAGGAEGQLTRHALALAARGVDVRVLCIRAGDGPATHALRAAGVVVEDIGWAAVDAHNAGSGSASAARGLMLAPLVGAVPRLGSLACAFEVACARIRPAVVHAWLDVTACAAGLGALAVGVPRIVLGGRSVAPHNFPLHDPFMRPVYRHLIERGGDDVILVNNSAAGAASYAAWLGVDRSRIHVVKNAVVVARGPERGDRKARQTITVGGMMRFHEEKCPLVFVEVARRVLKERPATRFVLVGDGPERPRVVRAIEAADLSSHVALPGVTDDPSSAQASFDILLATSRQEGLPNVVLEAQALGVPVVTTRAGGTAEAIIDGESALCADVGDVAGLASQTIRLIDDGDLRDRMGRAGAAFVHDTFGIERSLLAYDALYRR